MDAATWQALAFEILFHLQHREIEDQIKTVQARVLVLVGDGDWLIPSREEGPRLQKLLPRCILRVRLPQQHVASVLLSWRVTY